MELIHDGDLEIGQIGPHEEQGNPKQDSPVFRAEEHIDEEEGHGDEDRPLLQIFEDEIKQRRADKEHREGTNEP